MAAEGATYLLVGRMPCREMSTDGVRVMVGIILVAGCCWTSIWRMRGKA
jgi:hypothetical protein